MTSLLFQNPSALPLQSGELRTPDPGGRPTPRQQVTSSTQGLLLFPSNTSTRYASVHSNMEPRVPYEQPETLDMVSRISVATSSLPK